MDKDYIKAAIVNLPDESEETRRELASNPDTSERLLRQLAEDESVIVRTLVAKNESTPEDLVEYLKDGHILPENAIEVCEVYGNWDWRPQDFLDNVDTTSGDNVLEHAVIFGDFNFEDADWWTETVEFVGLFEDYLSDSDSVEDFLGKVREEYDDDYSSYDLNSLYDLYQQYDGYIDTDFYADAVEIANPNLDIEQDQIYSPDGRDSAYVIYEPDEFDLEELADWFFGNVYETREYYINFDDIPADKDLTLSEIYFDYGDDASDYQMFSNTDYERMKAGGAVEDEIRRMHGYHSADDCYVFLV